MSCGSRFVEASCYACIYLALALQLDGKLVTADRPFAEAVRRHQDVARHVVLLGERWDE